MPFSFLLSLKNKASVFLEVHFELFWLPCLHEVVLSSYEDLPLHTSFLITCLSRCGVIFFLPDVWCLCGCGTWTWNGQSFHHIPTCQGLTLEGHFRGILRHHIFAVIKMLSWNVPHYTYPRSWSLLINWRTFFRFLLEYVDCHTTIQDTLNFPEVMHQGTLFVDCIVGISSHLFPSSVTPGLQRNWCDNLLLGSTGFAADSLILLVRCIKNMPSSNLWFPRFLFLPSCYLFLIFSCILTFLLWQ